MLTVAQIAAQLGVSKWTVYRLVAAGQIAVERHRRSIRVSPEALAAYRATARTH